MTKKQRRFLHAALVVLGAFALDCGLSDYDPEVGSANFAYKVPQGERLQATALGGAWGVQPTGAIGPGGVVFDQVYVEKAELRAVRGAVTYAGSALVGTRLLARSSPALASPDLELFIGDMAPHNGQPGEFEYGVRYRTLGSGAVPTPLCQDAGARGLPVTGTWRPDGGFATPSAGVFSFACRGGVIVKCIDWGYKPWSSVGPAPGTPLRQFHQVCTRMARADYCTNGSSYTIERTPIDLYDRLPINNPTPPAPGEPPYFPETVWRTDSGSITGLPALMCLGKKRWDTIPLGGACPLQVVDPRVDRRAAYCEDKTWAEWKALGAVFANDSMYIDRGLFRWKKIGGEDHFTTSQYIYRGGQQSPTGPPPGGYQFAAFEGAVYRSDLASIGLLPAGSLVPLYSYFSPSRGDHLTTSVTDPNAMAHPPWDGLPLDYGAQTLVGYVYTPPPSLPWPAPNPRAKLLTSWWSPSRRIHITSRTKPAPAINDDFVLVRIEGYVIFKQ